MVLSEQNYLHVGGLVAMGFDLMGKYLLTVSHSGRGIFSVGDWQRVARDYAVVYPKNGKIVGIDVLASKTISVIQRDEVNDEIYLQSPCNRFKLLANSEGIKVFGLST